MAISSTTSLEFSLFSIETKKETAVILKVSSQLRKFESNVFSKVHKNDHNF